MGTLSEVVCATSLMVEAGAVGSLKVGNIELSYSYGNVGGEVGESGMNIDSG